MRRAIGFLLGVLLLGGCAVYPEPVSPAAGIYVAPPPAVVNRAAPLVGMGRRMASSVALMVERQESPGGL